MFLWINWRWRFAWENYSCCELFEVVNNVHESSQKEPKTGRDMPSSDSVVATENFLMKTPTLYPTGEPKPSGSAVELATTRQSEADKTRVTIFTVTEARNSRLSSANTSPLLDKSLFNRTSSESILGYSHPADTGHTAPPSVRVC